MAALRICKIEGCGKKSKGHGLCPMHLRRFRLTGDPLVTIGTPKGAPLEWLRNRSVTRAASA